jgi:hypothetical protein
MFARYIPLLVNKFKTLKVMVNSAVLELFKRSFKQYDNIKFYPLSEKFPRYDKSVVLSNLPYYLKGDISTIPTPSGYIIPNDEKIAEYKNKYFQNNDLKIGICWEAGASGWREQLNRTLNISMFEPLFKIPNTKIYSLQVRPTLDNYKNYPEIINLGKDFKDFDDTASAIKNLDVVVTVDTSVAHLAGALGVKTFMLLPYCPDWRWFDNDEKTEWYSSVRIFKQKSRIYWDDVVERIKEELINISK